MDLAADIKRLRMDSAAPAPTPEQLVRAAMDKLANLRSMIQSRLPDPALVMLEEYADGSFKAPLYPPHHADSRRVFLLGRNVGNEDTTRLSDLNNRLALNHVFGFAASGSGKTWLALQLLKLRGGIYFVCKDSDVARPEGSTDVRLLTDWLVDKLSAPPFKEDSDEVLVARRTIAELAAELLVFSRKFVLDAWQELYPKGKVTKEAWLLLQLFPKAFFKDGVDVFRAFVQSLIDVVWVSADSAVQGMIVHEMSNSLRPPPPPDFVVEVCVLDETQIWANALVNKFKSRQEVSSQVRRPLISPMLYSLGLHTTFLALGTGLGMLDMSKSAASNALMSFAEAVFTDFPPLDVQRVKGVLSRDLGVPDDETNRRVLDVAARWLAGRHRIVSNFVLDAISRPNVPLLSRVAEYKEEVTSASVGIGGSGPRSFHHLLSDLRQRASTLKVQGTSGVFVWPAFAQSAFAQINGYTGWNSVATQGMVFLVELAVEAGVAQLHTGAQAGLSQMPPLEALVLETFRRSFVSDELLTDWIRAGVDSASRGKRIEFLMPWFKPFALDSTMALEDLEVLGLAPSDAADARRSSPRLRDQRAKEVSKTFAGVWRQLSPQFGQVAVVHHTADEFYSWFARCVARLAKDVPDIDDSGEPFAAYPANHVRPDGAMFLERWVQDGSLLRRATAHEGPRFAVALFQFRAGSDVDINESFLTIEPELLSHAHASDAEKASIAERLRQSQTAFVASLKDFVVIRIVVSATQPLRDYAEVVYHADGGPRAGHSPDLKFVVSGLRALQEAFGPNVGKSLWDSGEKARNESAA